MIAGVGGIGTFDPSLGQVRLAKSELDADAFLQLLVAQLRYQDPLNVMDQQAFMQQLATMSSMQQQYQINEQLSSLVSQDSLSQSMNLIGHVVEGLIDGERVSGKVDGVTVIGGQPHLQVATEGGERPLPLDGVVGVR